MVTGMTGHGDWAKIVFALPFGFMLAAGTCLLLADDNRLPGQQDGSTSPFRLFRPQEYSEIGREWRRRALACLLGAFLSFLLMPLLYLPLRHALE